jgi:hypothetical protein
VHEFLLGHEFAARFDQDLDDLERARADGYGASAQPQFAPQQIGFPLARLIDRPYLTPSLQRFRALVFQAGLRPEPRQGPSPRP